MKDRRAAGFAAALVCAAVMSNAAGVPAQRKSARAVRRVTEFDMESPIRRRVKVPRHVAEQMVRSERDDGRDVDDERAADIAGSAEGTFVNLNDDGRDDLLVRADPGANITGFWLFRNNGRRWELVLYTVAADLSIKKTRTGGFHDVGIAAASAVTGWEATYKFDGVKYKPVACWEHDLGVGKNGEWGRGRRIKCGGDVKPYR